MICAVCGHQNFHEAPACPACGAALDSGANKGIETGGDYAGGNSSHGDSTVHLARGTRLNNGNYAIGEVLGHGGFGITYQGGDLNLRRYVAIKEFFPPDCVRQGENVAPSGRLTAADYAGAVAKFIEEARSLARFSDAGIVRVFGVFAENNTAYMVMEFLEGTTLARRLQEQTVLEESEAVAIAEKIGSALQVVHDAGVIHRDLKPDNICLTRDNRVVLIDFGTARAFVSGQTTAQTTMLTPGYSPLEQYGQQAKFGVSTDIYALAATFYHATTGQMPPLATDRASGVELVAPREINPQLSRAFSDALVWAMQIKVAERPQNVRAFLDALKNGSATQNSASAAVDLHKTTTATSSEWGAGAPSVAPAGTPFVPANAPSVASAQVTQITGNQLLTNAAPPEVLRVIQQNFVACGVGQAVIDAPNYRVVGAITASSPSDSRHIIGQVTQDGRGVMVTVNSRTTNAGPAANTEISKDDERYLLTSIVMQLRQLPADPNVLMSIAPVAPPNVYAPIAAPVGDGRKGYGNGQISTVQPQGGTILAFGALGLFCCPVFAPVAWICGNNALAAYSESDPSDKSSAKIGRTLGIIGTVLWSIYIITALSN